MVIGGVVYDIVVLFVLMCKNGKLLLEVVKDEFGFVVGFCMGLFMLFIIMIMMVGLLMVVLYVFECNLWGIFVVGIMILIVMGVGLFYKKIGNLKFVLMIGFFFLMVGVFIGLWV